MEENGSLEFSSITETKSDFETADADHTGIDRKALAADMQLIKGLVDDKDLAMLSRDQGGAQLGNSRTVIRHIQQAANRIRAMIETQSGDRGLYKDRGPDDRQRREMQGEAKALIGRALMEARAEYIRRSGKPLDGY